MPAESITVATPLLALTSATKSKTGDRRGRRGIVAGKMDARFGADWPGDSPVQLDCCGHWLGEGRTDKGNLHGLSHG